MAKVLSDISRTFDEFLILPGLTKKDHTPNNVSLASPLAKFKKGEKPRATLEIPIVSAAMQAVSGPDLAIALARCGGASFIFCSQPIESQAEMVRRVKEHKAGFVDSDSNLPPTATLADAVILRRETGHSTIAITEDGKRNSKLIGLLTSKDFWEFKDDLSSPVTAHFTPVDKLIMGKVGATLQKATELLWKNKKECLPIVDEDGNLHSLVFRRDYFDHKSNPYELTDKNKSLFVGASINTHDYVERSKALIEAGADALCVDSSDGYSEWQKDAILHVRNTYGSDIIVGGGNVVTAEGFNYLVKECDVDFVKIGIGGGSICTTRGQKGIGRGQASAVQEIASARDEYFKETGIYVPICSDGGIKQDRHITIALALGADFVMVGKYFASTEESPTNKEMHKGRFYKPYWGEGSNRARNWQRYKQGGNKAGLIFEEGVDAYVPYSGTLNEKVDVTVAKIKSTMCNTGVQTISELQNKSTLIRVSEMTFVESGTSGVERLDRS